MVIKFINLFLFFFFLKKGNSPFGLIVDLRIYPYILNFESIKEITSSISKKNCKFKTTKNNSIKFFYTK